MVRAGSSNPSEGKRRRPHARGRCGWGEVKRLLAKGNGAGAGAGRRELLVIPARLHSCSSLSALRGAPPPPQLHPL